MCAGLVRAAPGRITHTVDEPAADLPDGWPMPTLSFLGRQPHPLGRGRWSVRTLTASLRSYGAVNLRLGPVRRLRYWCRRWIKFLRTPAQGPFWHEHPDR